MIVRAVAKTDVGRVREHNEDAYLVDSTYQVYAVADGMGGHAGGAAASALAVQTVQAHLLAAGALLLDDAVAQAELTRLAQATASMAPVDVLADEALAGAGPVAVADVAAAQALSAIPYVVYDVWDPGIDNTSVAPVVIRLLADAVRLACAAIYHAAAQDAALMGMGTTTTLLCVHKQWAYVAHVGDSRCYVQRDGSLMQVTEDHSLVNEQVKAGLITPELARTSRQKNIITRSVGFEPEVEVDSFILPVRAGDQFVLCSDGLSNLVEDVELGETMMQLRGQSLLDFLITLALGRGGDDNITVVTVDLLDDADPDAP